MKHLRDTVSEAVSRGHKKVSYNHFPVILGFQPKKSLDELIVFLENNGFIWYTGPFFSCEDLSEQFGSTNQYYYGLCDERPETWWVCFGNKGRVYFCRLRNQHRPDAFRVYVANRWHQFKDFDEFRSNVSKFFNFKWGLDECVLEAVSKGGRKNVPKFPKDRLEDRQKIIDWLEECGYVQIPRPNVDPVYQLKQHYKTYHDKCYILGLFDKTSKGTHWIMFYDGDRTFFLRLDWSVANKQSLNGNAIIEPGNRNPKKVTLDELIKELDE